MDTEQDPCEDFYQYSGGGWLAAHPLPASKAAFGQFDQVSQQNLQIIRKIISLPLSTAPKTPDALSLKKLKDMYASCMDEKTLDKVGQEPLLELTRQVRKTYIGDTQKWSWLGAAQRLMQLRDVDDEEDDDNEGPTKTGLTSTLSLLHTRG